GEKTIRRFVNVVAENIKSALHSLHRLDVSKHLFYPSAAEAEAEAEAAAALKRKSSGWAPQIPTLECLPARSICFRSTPTTRWDNASMEFFALLSPRRSESRIFCSTNSGHSVLYHADSHRGSARFHPYVQCMPSLQDEFIGRRPITFSTGHPSVPEEDLFHLASRCTVIQPKDRMDDCTRSRKGCTWESLPPLPFGGTINSHTLIDDGRTICVSSAPDADGWGTYCFDTTPDDWSTLRFDILNLGEGKFCMVEIFEIAGDSESEDYFELGGDFAVLTGVDSLSGDGDRKLEGLRIHKSRRYTFMQDQVKWER
ncbi:hypothetical protein PVAP13_1KG058177, partial [Panicum virgatum]